MNTKKNSLGTWLPVVVLVAGAFFAGAQLRALHGTEPIVYEKTPAQASALLKLTPELSPVTPTNGTHEAGEDKELVGSVVRLLKAHYVDPITAERETAMARGAVQGMLDSLADTDCRYLDPTERKLLDDAGAGKFHGIGAVFAIKDEKVGDLEVNNLVVITPMPGSPAEKAGLKSGDSVTHIDGKWIARYDPFKEADLENLAKAARNKEIDWFTYQEASKAAFNKLKEGASISETLHTLTSKSAGEVSLRVERPKEIEPIEMKVSCATTQIDPVTFRILKQNIAYMRITQFSQRAAREFAEELNRVRSGHAKGLILDLRGNPGGLMDTAAEVIGKIAGGGLIANIQDNKGRRAIRRPSAQGIGIPVVILVDGGTSSVAELVAGTLRDRGVATIVGTKTFGDGLTQTPLILRDGSAAVLTTGKMLTAKGFDFNGKGLTPDKKVEQDSSSDDAQLEAAENALLARIGKA